MKFFILGISLCFTFGYSFENDNLEYSLFYKDSLNHLQELGRDNDPKIRNELSKFKITLRKIGWEILSLPGLRFMCNLIYPSSTISHFDREGAVAFTIDDGFCGVDNPNGCMVEEIIELFKKYDSNATFFVNGSHCLYTDKLLVSKLHENGHEIANHNMMDWPYDKYTSEEFLRDFNRTEEVLFQYRKNSPKWYRAPFGKINKKMQSIIDQKGLINVVTDAFAHDTAIPDPDWIAKFILKKVRPGSIVLIHMPERNVREWNFEAMEKTLAGLKQKNYKVVNLTQLYNEDY